MSKVQNIQRLMASQFQGCKHIEMTIGDKTMTFVEGPNGSGKSSFLNAFKKMVTKSIRMKNPVHEGATSSEALIETDEVIIEETVSELSKSLLTVTFKDTGVQITGKKAMDYVQDHLESMGSDPYRLLSLPRDRQFAVIAGILIGDDAVENYIEDRKLIYQERTDVNRVVAELKGKTKTTPEKIEPIDTESTMNELRELQAAKEKYNSGVHRQQELMHAVQDNERKILELKNLLQEEENSLAYNQKLLNTATTWLKGNGPNLKKIEELEFDLQEAGQNNQLAAVWTEFKADQKRLEERKEKSDELTKRLKDLDQDIAAKIRERGLPKGFDVVDGEFVDSNYLPMENWQHSDTVKFAYMVAGISVADKDIRLLLIHEANALDDSKLTELHSWAKENQITVVLETPREVPGFNTVKIQAGELV